MNYAKNLARDVGGAAMQHLPAPIKAQTVVNTTNAVASSVISLTQHTTSLEVGAFGGQGVVIRWVAVGETAAVAPRGSVVSSGLGANFDHFIPEGTVRRFVVPRETIGAHVGAAGSINGLYQRVARVSAGITASSVLLTEY